MAEEQDAVVSENAEELSHYDMIMAQQSISTKDLREHLTGPVIALVLHLIALPLAMTLVIMDAPKEEQAVKVEAFQEEMKAPEPPPEPPEPPEPTEANPTEVVVDRPPIDAEPVEDVADDKPVSLIDPTEKVEMPTAIAMRPNNSPKVLSSLYSLRGGGKGAAVRGGGGSGEGQLALARGLQWLAQVQKSDGSWGDGGNSPALTGMAVLAFLAHGELPSSARYGSTVTKGIQKLISYAQFNGDAGVNCDPHQYGHSIVTYALAEAAAMTKLPVVIEAMDKCTKVIVDGINKKGGFWYNYGKRGSKYGDPPNSDLSYGGWNYQALKAAFAAGSTAPGLSEVLDKCIPGIKENYSKNGKYFFYETHAKGSKEMAATLTPVGVLCLQLLGDGKAKEVKDGIEFITKDRNGALMDMEWKTRGPRTEREYGWCIYAWYYQTQVLFQAGEGKKDDPNWRKWRLSFEKALVTEQYAEGYWDSPCQKYPNQTNSFREDPGSVGGGLNTKIYSTALCSLMLEVYYRFLPSYHLVKEKTAAGAESADADEGLITID